MIHEPSAGAEVKMEADQVLIAGIGGLGCSWAMKSHQHCQKMVDLLLIDSDETVLSKASEGHLLRLGEGGDSNGCAALPPLAEQRMRSMASPVLRILENVELVILLTGLGGGTGSGASAEFARQAKQSGAMVLTIAAMPFSSQFSRLGLADRAIPGLEAESDVCVRLSLDRLAAQARARGSDWRVGAAWVEELIDGLVRTLMRLGLINLDMMDLKAIIGHEGGATMIVGSGEGDDAEGIFNSAMEAPLAELDIEGAQACLIQVEGGPGLTIGQVDAVANAFTKGLHEDSQVILGARVSEDLIGIVRVVAVMAGL